MVLLLLPLLVIPWAIIQQSFMVVVIYLGRCWLLERSSTLFWRHIFWPSSVRAKIELELSTHIICSLLCYPVEIFTLGPVPSCFDSTTVANSNCR